MDQVLCNQSAQLVTASGEFVVYTSHAKEETVADLAEDLEEDVPYACAIIGAQGSGKSTLLNELFKTDFPVLDATLTGPRRTTEGVWYALVSVPQRKDELLVLDIEGLDSKERGAAGRIFEQRAAFFVAYVADILILNVFSREAGRKNSATYRVLRNVLEERFRLTKASIRKDRVILLVVFRDYCEEETPSQDLERTMIEELHELWRQVVESEDTKLEELYGIEFFYLPNKLFENQSFDLRISSIRKRTMELWHATSEGFGHSASFLILYKDLWTQISYRLGEADLRNATELTSIAELLTAFHCSRIIRHIIENVRRRIGVLHSEILEHINDQQSIASVALEIHEDCFRKYKWMARHYLDTASYRSKEQELRQRLWLQPDGELAELVRQYWLVVTDNTCRRFEEDFAPVLGGTAAFERQAHYIREKWSSNLSTYLRGESKILESELKDSQLLQQTCMEKFHLYTGECILERRQQGAVMLPTVDGAFQAGGKTAEKKTMLQRLRPLFLRALVIYLNYLQAKQQGKSAYNRSRRCDLDMPLGPTF
jgi:GTPase SAR1 family protein